ncbi:MAG: hypothetical protein ACRDGL_02750 [Candidatus Limnocylindrales bacterium]
MQRDPHLGTRRPTRRAAPIRRNEDADPPVRLTRVGGPEQLAVPLVALIIGLLVLAVVKPWSPPPARPAGPPAPALAAALTTSGARLSIPGPIVPAGTPRPVGQQDLPCLTPDGWRLVTLGRSADRETRTWLVVRPVMAAGPSDRTIPRPTLGSAPLVGVGVCAPAAGGADEQVAGPWSLVAPRIVGLWRLSPAQAPVALLIAPLDPSVPVPGSAVPPGLPSGGPGSSRTSDPYDGPQSPALGGRLAVLYGAPRRPAGSTASAAPGTAASPATGTAASSATGTTVSPASGAAATWPAGRYVFVVAEPGTDASLWFGFEITSPPAH